MIWLSLLPPADNIIESRKPCLAEWAHLHIAFGLNTGMMSVENMVSEFRLSYTVSGDAVNLGSRLEGLTKTYGVELIVSEKPGKLFQNTFFANLTWLRKEKDKPIAIYEPVAPKEEISEDEMPELASASQALTAYRQQNWKQAQQLFEDIKQLSPDSLLYNNIP